MERDDWDRRWGQRGFHCDDDPTSVLATELGALPPGRALDLGCGAGRGAAWLADRGWRVTGVDFSEVALGRAREARPEVDWVLADVRLYEPEPEAFDLVLLLYLHLPAAERRGILASAAGALLQGGTLLVVGHDLTNIGTGAPGPTRPDVLYTPDELTSELEGLDVLKAERVMRRVETDDGEADAVDTVILARKT